MQNLLSMLLGALTTWLCTKLYYQKAAKDLEKVANELKRHNLMMLEGMENQGWIELNRDSKGNIVGYVRLVKGSIKAESKLSGSLTVEHKDKQ
jgi:hypothetical protein